MGANSAYHRLAGVGATLCHRRTAQPLPPAGMRLDAPSGKKRRLTWTGDTVPRTEPGEAATLAVRPHGKTTAAARTAGTLTAPIHYARAKSSRRARWTPPCTVVQPLALRTAIPAALSRHCRPASA